MISTILLLVWGATAFLSLLNWSLTLGYSVMGEGNSAIRNWARPRTRTRDGEDGAVFGVWLGWFLLSLTGIFGWPFYLAFRVGAGKASKEKETKKAKQEILEFLAEHETDSTLASALRRGDTETYAKTLISRVMANSGADSALNLDKKFT